MADLTLRPLSLGGQLDRAVTIFRARPGAILVAVLAAMALPLLMIANKVPRVMAVAASMQHDPRDPAVLRDAAALMGGMLGVAFVGLVGFVVARTAVGWIAHKALLGERADAFEGLEKGIRFLPAMFGLVLVEGAIYCVAMGVLYLVGALVVLGGLRHGTPPSAVPLIAWVLSMYGTLVFITTGLFVTPPVLLAEEGAGVFSTIGRSFALTKGRRGAIFGGILLLMLISTLVYLAIGLGAGALVGSGAVDVGRSTPFLFGVDVVVNILTVSFYFIFQMVVYYDLRIRKEGLDLDLAAASPAKRRPGASSPARPSASASTRPSASAPRPPAPPPVKE